MQGSDGSFGGTAYGWDKAHPFQNQYKSDSVLMSLVPLFLGGALLGRLVRLVLLRSRPGSVPLRRIRLGCCRGLIVRFARRISPALAMLLIRWVGRRTLVLRGIGFWSREGTESVVRIAFIRGRRRP